jgi:hypothetical protein
MQNDNNTTMVDERVAKLTGEDAKEFEEYDSRELTDEEIKSLEEAKAVYRKFAAKNNNKTNSS